MVFCTDIVTKTGGKIFSCGTNSPQFGNRDLESKITELHFSNGLVFKYNGIASLSSDLSWFLMRNKFKPFGSRFMGNAIVELRCFPYGEYKLMDYLDFTKVSEYYDDPQQDGNFLTIGKSDKTYGVVCQSMHYYMQLNNLFDIILSGELDLQDVSSMYSRIDDRITVIYSGYMHKGYRYKYEYKVTDLDKFQLLLTKISIRYSKFF